MKENEKDDFMTTGHIENNLVVIEKKSAAALFVPQGLDPLLERIRQEVESFVSDISTKQGRAEIASFAYKLARSKTAIDNAGKELASDMKKQVKIIDLERARAWDEMEKLQAAVRKPLTEWENVEAERVAGHENALKIIDSAGLDAATPADFTVALGIINAYLDRDWQEFKERGLQAINRRSEQLVFKRDAAVQAEAERAELKRLRREEEARKQREHEERIAKEAAERARLEAEQAAAAAMRAAEEREAAEKAAKEAAERRAAEEKERAERAEAEAKAAAARAEAERIAAAERAEREKKEAAEQAAAAERKRQADEQAAKDAADAQRQADEAHRLAVRLAVINGFMELMPQEDAATRSNIAAIVDSAIAGKIPHIKVIY